MHRLRNGSWQNPDFHPVTSRPTCRDSLDHQLNPAVCGFSPQHYVRPARCESPHGPADSSVGRHDGVSAHGLPCVGGTSVTTNFCFKPSAEPVWGHCKPYFLLNVPPLMLTQGASSLAFVILFSVSVFRRISYELFLRTHQALAALVVFAVWRHLPSGSSFARVSLYVLVGLFLFLCIAQVVIVFYQNGFFRPGRAEAKLTHVYGAVRLRIQCRKPVQFQPGQYINLWMPSVSFWSFLQSHPFIVISWAEKPQEYLDLFVEPRGGLTQKLLSRAQKGGTTHFPLLFSGPHGKSICMDDCDKILLVASDFGIAAQLPYLKRLIRGYNERRLRAQRVHLVWQVRDLSKSCETRHGPARLY